jgi:cyclic patellamide precursor peptide PatG/subtilase family protein
VQPQSAAIPLALSLPGLDLLWRETKGSQKVCVAVIDGPVDLGHPSLRPARLQSVASGVPCGPASHHGTFVASVLFGRHGAGVQGLVPGCRGISIPVFHETADGWLGCSIPDLARAITQAAELGARVINVSGGHLSDSDAHPILARAVAFAVSCGAVIVAAAGNEGCDCPHVPASIPTVLAVGALGPDGLPTLFSNWSARYARHLLHAPGAGIVGATPGGGTTTRSSTSAATAVVSGLIALVMSARLARGDEADAGQARDLLLQTARALPLCSNGALAVDLLSLIPELHTKGTRTIMTSDIEELETDITDLLPTPPDDISVRASDCACGGGAAAAGKPSEPSCSCGSSKLRAQSLVYAIGKIDYEFASEARRDSLTQQTGLNVSDPHQLLQALERNPPAAESVTWLLSLEGTPVYAIKPEGAFAATAFERLRDFFRQQLDDGVEAISLPGVIAHGQVRLRGDRFYPMVIPDVRGMFSWSVSALVNEAAGESTPAAPALREFLDRVYFAMRNLGVASQERALNYAATNVFQVTDVFRQASGQGLELDGITAERSPLCRPESDCWDILLTFFDPRNRMTTARRVYRVTVDVSDVLPVTVGTIRSWSIY